MAWQGEAQPSHDPWDKNDPWGGVQGNQDQVAQPVQTWGHTGGTQTPEPQTQTETVWDTAETGAQDNTNQASTGDSQSQGGWWAQSQGTQPQEQGADSWSSWKKQSGSATDAWAQNSWQTNQPVAEDPNQQRHETYRREYYECQEWYKQSNITPDTHNAKSMFSDESGEKGDDFFLYNSVEVRVTGEGSENLPKHLETFDDLFSRCDNIPEQLRENLKLLKFQNPTPVQKYAVIAGLAGRDVMCCAQTGSGKTAAYLIPMLASMMRNKRATGAMTVPFEGPCEPDTLILAPTRELVLQIFEDALRFCYGTAYRVIRVYGQEKRDLQIRDFSKGADVCVATPGRFADFVEATIISVKKTYCLVLDEADRMMELGFEQTIGELVEQRGMPDNNERQTMMFSATFPEQIQNTAQKYLNNHFFVTVGRIGSPSATVTQVVFQVQKGEKLEKLVELIDAWMKHQRKTGTERMLVFTNSRNQAKALDEYLWDKDVAKTGALHGDLDQSKRESNLNMFREGNIQVMIATDVAARGLDISKVSHVVNYDLPKESAIYVHRIGRTGRIGHRGTALSFVTLDQTWWLDDEEMLRDLPGIMQGAPNTEVPDWLKEKADSLTAGTWGSTEEGTTDARSAWSKSVPQLLQTMLLVVV